MVKMKSKTSPKAMNFRSASNIVGARKEPQTTIRYKQKPWIYQIGASVIAVSAGLVGATPAGAAVGSLVSACSGVSLPPSAVTNILSPVLTGIVSPIQNTVNSILPVALPLFPTLNVNVTGLLTTAAAGQPVSLAVLKTDGTVFGPSDQCNTTADSFQVNTAKGISIGGNQITGLGGQGVIASAGELGSIAFGNNATTDATAVNSVAVGAGAKVGAGGTGSVALGNGANATVANSLALGANAVASRGARAGYAAPGLAAPQNSFGEVSVGAPGGERQITNVAAGSAGTDAVNVSQLTSTLAAATGDAVQYDSAAHTSVTLGGVGALAPVALTNVAPGAISATSTDAVNGSQLNATNTAVTNVAGGLTTTTANLAALGNTTAANLGGGSTYSDAGGISLPSYTIKGSTYNNVGSALGAVDTSLMNIQNGTSGLVQQAGGAPGIGQITIGAATGGTSISVAGTAGSRTITGVASGALTPASLDAVNGGQVNGLGTSLATNLGGGSVFDPVTGTTTAPSYTVGGTAYTNVGAALGAQNTIVGAQGASLATVLGGAATYNPATGTVSGQSFTVGGTAYGDVTNAFAAVNASIGGGAGIKYFHANSTLPDSIAAGADSVAIGPNAVAVNAGDVAIGNGSISAAPHAGSFTLNGGVAAGTTPTSVVSFGAAGAERQLQNIGSGVISATSTDAVNGSQLFAVGTAVNTLGGGLASSLGGGSIVAPDGTVTNPSYAVGGTIYNNVGGAISALQATAPLQYSTPAAPSTPNGLVPSQSVTLVGAAAGPVTLSNVAAGSTAAGSTQAINGGQLNAGLGSVAAALGGGATYNSATGSVTAPAYAVQGATYSDIGSALAATNGTITNQGASITNLGNQVAGNTTSITALTNGTVGLVQQTGGAPGAGQITIGAGTGGTSVSVANAAAGTRTITGVAAGAVNATSTDAVNGAQLLAAEIVSGNPTPLGVSTAAALGGGSVFSPTAAGVTAPTYTVGGQAYNNVGGAIDATNNLAVQYTPDAAGRPTPAVDLTKGGAIAPTTVSGVAAGAVTATSTEAVNGAQLFSTNRHVAGDTAALGGGAAFDPGTGTYTPPTYVIQGVARNNVGAALTALDAVVGQASAQSVQYDDPSHTSLTLNSGGPAVGLHNVAPGVAQSDAVNVGQLQASSAATLNQAYLYTDGRINALNFDLRREINTTGARTAALAGVPQSVVPGEGFVGGAIGGQGDQVAFALGVSKVFDAKHTPIIKATVSMGTRGNDAAYNVGGGIHF